MPRQVPAVMQNPQDFDSFVNHSVKQKVAGRFHALALNAITAAGQMVGVNAVRKFLLPTGGRAKRVFSQIQKRLAVNAS